MDQPRINHGSTWINVDQPPSVCRPDSWLMRQTHGSCVRRQTHGSCVRRQASGVRRQTHGSCVRRQASGVQRPDSCVRRQASGVRRQASGVRRQASGVPRPFSHRRPLSVMTTTKRRQFIHALLPSDLRLLSCTARGNRVVLPTLYSPTGAIVRIKTGRGVQERRGLLLLIRKRPA